MGKAVIALLINSIICCWFVGSVKGADKTCGGNCPGRNCDKCHCPTWRNPVSVSEWCGKNSGWSQACCQCIVQRESGGNANAVRQNIGVSSSYKYDVGLWQINSFNWGACNGGRAPCDLYENLQCAQMVFQWGGNTWRRWNTCTMCGCCFKA